MYASCILLIAFVTPVSSLYRVSLYRASTARDILVLNTELTKAILDICPVNN